MKKRIKLTESDLHNIIKESVKNVLTELDWRTYLNAHQKANDVAHNPNSSRRDKFVKKDQANKFYNKAKELQQQQYDGVDLINARADMDHLPNYKYKTHKDSQTYYTQKKHPGYEPNGGYQELSKRKQLKGQDEINDYFQDNVKYKNGKWTKK